MSQWSMKKYEVISIEPTALSNQWVITYRMADGKTDKESIEAADSHAAFIKFRNQMMSEAKG